MFIGFSFSLCDIKVFAIVNLLWSSEGMVGVHVITGWSVRLEVVYISVARASCRCDLSKEFNLCATTSALKLPSGSLN